MKRHTDKCQECGKPHFPGLVSTYCLDCSVCFGTLISGGSLSEEQRKGIEERKALYLKNQDDSVVVGT